MFLQNIWHVIKDDLIDFFKEVHESETFVNSLNSTFLAIIAKMEKTNQRLQVNQFGGLHLQTYLKGPSQAFI